MSIWRKKNLAFHETELSEQEQQGTIINCILMEFAKSFKRDLGGKV